MLLEPGAVALGRRKQRAVDTPANHEPMVPAFMTPGHAAQPQSGKPRSGKPRSGSICLTDICLTDKRPDDRGRGGEMLLETALQKRTDPVRHPEIIGSGAVGGAAPEPVLQQF